MNKYTIGLQDHLLKNQDQPETADKARRQARGGQAGKNPRGKTPAEIRVAARKQARKKVRALAARPTLVELAPIASRARMCRRHWGVLFSFFLMVVLPSGTSWWYLHERAADPIRLDHRLFGAQGRDRLGGGTPGRHFATFQRLIL
jgi:hypothetical protein